MKAMVLNAAGQRLRLTERRTPEPGPGEILIGVKACAVCRTDLHVIDGDLTGTRFPLVPGHEIVGHVISKGRGVDRVSIGDRVGIPWLGRTCGTCCYCTTGRENLCDLAQFTGWHIDGGFATHCLADANYCFKIPDCYDDLHAAPLLCAGLIGYRSLKAAGDAKHIGIFGFGAAAHIVAQIALQQGKHIFAFSRPGDMKAQEFALDLGAVWAGGSDQPPPEPLDAAIIFAPVGSLVPLALRAIRKGGTLVLGGIYMSEIPAMPYELLWGERVVRSVANLTRQDGIEFMSLAASFPIVTTVQAMPLAQANDAVRKLRHGEVTGAVVLVP